MVSPLAEAHRLGEQILRLLRWPLEEGEQQAMDQQLEERERALREAVELLAAGSAAAVTAEEVQMLAAQQKALEEQARRVLKTLESGSQDAQAARSAMQGVSRILHPGVRPRYMDEKR